MVVSALGGASSKGVVRMERNKHEVGMWRRRWLLAVGTIAGAGLVASSVVAIWQVDSDAAFPPSPPPPTVAVAAPRRPVVLAAAVPAPVLPLVVVASDEGFADVLAAGAGAAWRGAPVLLTAPDVLRAETAAKLRLARPGAILVMGGPSAVGEAVVASLERLAPGRVARIAGEDRYETAALLAERLFPDRLDLVYVASGLAFADALAAGPVAGRAGAPVLLITADTVPPGTADALRRFRPREIRVLGGSAVVGDAVVRSLADVAGTVTRVAGSTRFDTAVELSKASFPGGSKVAYLANGLAFADVLVGGPQAAAEGAPLLLTEPSCIPPAVRDELRRLGRPRLVLLGESVSIGPSLDLATVCTSALPLPSPPPPAPPTPQPIAPRTLPPVTGSGLERGARIGIGFVETYGYPAHVGADLLDGADRKICSPTPDCTYWGLQNIWANGRPELGGIAVEADGVRGSRLELYPDLVQNDWTTNDTWNPNLLVGGIHLWNPDGRPVLGLRLPHASNGAVRYVAPVVDGGVPVVDGRVRSQVFQVVPKDATAGAFNIASTRGGRWTAGWIWPGLYELFFFDDATGHAIQTRGALDPALPITVDVARPCFGFPTCTTLG